MEREAEDGRVGSVFAREEGEEHLALVDISPVRLPPVPRGERVHAQRLVVRSRQRRQVDDLERVVVCVFSRSQCWNVEFVGGGGVNAVRNNKQIIADFAPVVQHNAPLFGVDGGRERFEQDLTPICRVECVLQRMEQALPDDAPIRHHS
eukprot:CAMPEP_0196734816 /NCGR_PEP_ID=MMETSP1091-20130531/13446_1 /TAXON_ID=302021 /ORGANISM="Rhodomonas sp., Strain CCMP768" /LENGTH=148 /DNA_ID=CAMNT_0042078377 /DNA_START=33 /DNA_END=479 /DNA_ORIENTATION=-